MSDLIDRQDAIDALMSWEEYSVWDEDCLKHRGEPYWVAPSDVIKQLPSAQPEQRWIPCSIKQPQKGLMLVTFNDGDIALLKQPTAYRRSDIVAWMPVEPYREEGEE